MAEGLAGVLRATWERQRAAGFLLGDPNRPVEVRTAPDEHTGVAFRFRWLPHRDVRGDPGALERLGILDPLRDRTALHHDPRDPLGRHCFLCPGNVRLCHPAEELVPIDAGGRRWWAGANFAWLGPHHFTVMSDTHEDQRYDDTVLDTLLSLHDRLGGAFRVLFNPPGAGATIPWHLHLQVTSGEFPIESLAPGADERYPITVWRFAAEQARAASTRSRITAWLDADPLHHRVNLLVAGNGDLFVVPRDVRRSHAARKGLMGGFEVFGDFVFSDLPHRGDFEAADLDAARAALEEIEPESLRRRDG